MTRENQGRATFLGVAERPRIQKYASGDSIVTIDVLSREAIT
jgi:hypothetical protein